MLIGVVGERKIPHGSGVQHVGTRNNECSILTAATRVLRRILLHVMFETSILFARVHTRATFMYANVIDCVQCNTLLAINQTPEGPALQTKKSEKLREKRWKWCVKFSDSGSAYTRTTEPRPLHEPKPTCTGLPFGRLESISCEPPSPSAFRRGQRLLRLHRQRHPYSLELPHSRKARRALGSQRRFLPGGRVSPRWGR